MVIGGPLGLFLTVQFVLWNYYFFLYVGLPFFLEMEDSSKAGVKESVCIVLSICQHCIYCLLSLLSPVVLL